MLKEECDVFLGKDCLVQFNDSSCLDKVWVKYSVRILAFVSEWTGEHYILKIHNSFSECGQAYMKVTPEDMLSMQEMI